MAKAGNVFSNLMSGECGFDFLKEKINVFRTIVSGDSGMGFFYNLIGSLSAILPYIMIVVMLAFAFFGKKSLPLAKFIFFFVFGFSFGIYLNAKVVSDIFAGTFAIPSWVIGLVMGILAAILYRLLYVIFFASVTLYMSFTLLTTAFSKMLENNASMGYIFMIVAVIAMVVAFIFRKYTEMLGTAVLGGWAIAHILGKCVLDGFSGFAFLDGKTWIATLVITLVIAIPAFFVQFKTRRRY